MLVDVVVDEENLVPDIVVTPAADTSSSEDEDDSKSELSLSSSDATLITSLSS
jgi:hypothetical protein